jgi:hypothetical protein
MTDDESGDSAAQSYQDRINKRTREEFLAFENDPIAKAQRQLDFWMEQKLAERAWARRTEKPERGAYDPMRRFEEEMAYEEELAGRRYRREVR